MVVGGVVSTATIRRGLLNKLKYTSIRFDSIPSRGSSCFGTIWQRKSIDRSSFDTETNPPSILSYKCGIRFHSALSDGLPQWLHQSIPACCRGSMVVDRTVRYLLQKPHSRRCLERTAAKPRIEQQCCMLAGHGQGLSQRGGG